MTDRFSPSAGEQALANVRVVLVRTTHPGNIGAAARAMATMGLRELVLVAPRRFPDPEAVARAANAAPLLDRARVVGSLGDALNGCTEVVGLSARPRVFAGRVSAIRDAARSAAAQALHSPVALVFGTEMSGLSNEELARCGVVATIPTDASHGSLNVAAAVQVACYEMRMASIGGEVWHAPRFPAASHDEIERLYAHAEQTLAAMHFLDPRMPRRLLPRLRRLFARAGLEKEEVNILRGILARIDQVLARRKGR
jgi:tRNA/rRNA methyltransferase